MSTETNHHMQSLKTLRGEQVIYRRGTTLSVPLVAIPAKLDVEGVDTAGTVTMTRMRDWLVEASDLVDGSGEVTPESGDEIQFGTRTFQVTRPALDLPCYRDVDEAGEWLRIHSQRI